MLPPFQKCSARAQIVPNVQPGLLPRVISRRTNKHGVMFFFGFPRDALGSFTAAPDIPCSSGSTRAQRTGRVPARRFQIVSPVGPHGGAGKFGDVEPGDRRAGSFMAPEIIVHIRKWRGRIIELRYPEGDRIDLVAKHALAESVARMRLAPTWPSESTCGYRRRGLESLQTRSSDLSLRTSGSRSAISSG
jgi:hypothetical protein